MKSVDQVEARFTDWCIIAALVLLLAIAWTGHDSVSDLSVHDRFKALFLEHVR
jgi:hypothetical protein